MAKKVNLDVAQTLNITCRRGDTFQLNMTLKDSEGVPLVLDGSVGNNGAYKFAMQVRESAFQDDATGLIASTTEGLPSGAASGSYVQINEIKGSASGAISVFIPASEMVKISSGRYVYDLQYINPASAGADFSDVDVIKTILKGSFVVNEDVTDTSNPVTEDARGGLARLIRENKNY
jgi:hypothetical protein